MSVMYSMYLMYLNCFSIDLGTEISSSYNIYDLEESPSIMIHEPLYTETYFQTSPTSE